MEAAAFLPQLLLILAAARVSAGLGRTSGILDNQVYAGMVIAITTLLPPFAMKWMYRRWEVIPAT